jgi:hypothetical protein
METKFFITLLVWLCFISAPGFAGQDSSLVQVGRIEKISFWLWPEREMKYDLQRDTKQKFVPDVLYVKSGELTVSKSKGKDEIHLSLDWPTFLPKALSYQALVRIDPHTHQVGAFASKLASEYIKLKKAASIKGYDIKGLQIDYDCPTEKLSNYATFLKSLRPLLGDNSRISITALPDWFRKNTDIHTVIEQVDEFVPQFYDIDSHPSEIDLYQDATGITSPIDVKKWEPIFNSFSKPYMIGISSFGRALNCELAEGEISPKSGKVKIQSFSKQDFRQFNNQKEGKILPFASLTSAEKERILRFDSTKECECCKKSFIEVIVPTRDSFMRNYEAAKSFGGRCIGITIFRWSDENEMLVLPPEELAEYIAGGPDRSEYTLKIKDGYCAAVQCSEIFLGLKKLFPEEPITVKIVLSSPLEYFIPADHIKSRPDGERSILIMAPPYTLTPNIYLGRMVTKKQTDFAVQELKK